MANLSPNKGARFRAWTMLAAGLLLTPMISVASSTPAPFTYEYGFTGSKIPFTIKATRTLKQVGPNKWQTQLGAKNILGEITETSFFSWQGCTPVASDYKNFRKGLGQTRESHLVLNHTADNPTATLYRGGEKNREVAITANATDMLSLPLAIQCQLQQDPRKKMSFEVASERRHETLDFIIKGTQKVTTPAGEFSTIRIERDRGKDAKRNTIMWFSTDHNYALVKMIQEDDSSSYE